MAKDNILDTIIARASQSKADKIGLLDLETETLGHIKVTLPPLKDILEFLEGDTEEDDVYSGLLSNASLVYENVPFLKNNYAQLADAYDEKDPARLTLKIFEVAQAIGELNSIANFITESYGVGKEAVKN